MLLTPETEPELLCWLRLMLSPRIGLRAQQRLLRSYPSAPAIFAAPAAEISACIGQTAAEALASGPLPGAMAAARLWLQQPGHHIITLGSPEYPFVLSQIPDPPPLLYAQGRIDLLNALAIAIVGSRNASPQGVSDAESFGEAFASAGMCVVSGMALGIDAAAHRGALRGAGSTIAVLGTGPDIIYPPRNRDLAADIVRCGLAVSEFPPGTPVVASNFPRRNRIISGLSRGVLVIEAAKSSGSLITARLAADQGRDVFAIPGSIHSPLSKGCHYLIREGAKLVECAEDVICELGWDGKEDEPPPSVELRPEEALLESLDFSPVCVDQIAHRTGLPADEIATRLSLLEIAGRVVSLPGGWFQRQHSEG
jgi:DNA processing protein